MSANAAKTEYDWPEIVCVDGPQRVHCHHWWAGADTCCHCYIPPMALEMAELVRLQWHSMVQRL